MTTLLIAAARFPRLSFTLALSLVWLSPTAAQTVPKERPRARPPSALTGWADWEKGEESERRR